MEQETNHVYHIHSGNPAHFIKCSCGYSGLNGYDDDDNPLCPNCKTQETADEIVTKVVDTKGNVVKELRPSAPVVTAEDKAAQENADLKARLAQVETELAQAKESNRLRDAVEARQRELQAETDKATKQNTPQGGN